jgi:hypothetical protein
MKTKKEWLRKENDMRKRIILFLCVSLCFISEALSQYSFNRHQFFGENNRYSTIYIYADSSNDTVHSVVLKDSAIRSSSRSIVIMEEIGMGTLMGAGLSLPCGLIAGTISGGNDWDRFGAALIGAYTGFTVGYSYCVYFFSKI